MYKSYLLAAVLLLLGAVKAQADVIGLKTSKTAGTEMTLALNADVTATLTWSNGESESITFDGFPMTVTVKSDSLTITSTSGTITRLYVPNAGLVSLNTKGATSLTKLYCPDNELTSLTLSSNKALTDIDCQNNKLSTLTLTNCRSIQNLNIAGNKLTTAPYITAAPLTMLVCADNQIDTLRYMTSLSKLEVLICQNNALRTLNLRNAKQLRRLVASSNDLTTLTMAAMPALTDVWVENNNLTSIDLSAGSGKLAALSADHNNLTSILWDNSCKSTLTQFYGNDNTLFFNSFPTRSSKLTATYMPQNPYPLLTSANINETVYIASTLTKNGFGATQTRNYTLVDEAGYTLERGQGKDYYYNTSGWTFYTGHKNVVMTVTANLYPDVTLTTQPFDIIDPTGISTVKADANGLTISAAAGTLNVSTSTATTVHVYTLEGRSVVNATIGAGTHSWSLPAGVYIVNKHKVIVP